LYDSAKWAMSMFFVVRLHLIFKSSALRISPSFLLVLVVLLTSTWLWGLWQTLGVLTGLVEPTSTKAIAHYSCLAVIDSVVTVSYLQRLLKVIIGTEVIVGDQSLESTESTISVENKMFQSLTKTTLLNLIGMLSTLSIICIFMNDAVSAREIPTVSPYMTIGLRCLDGIINTFCIYLVFQFAEPVYERSCKYCHRGMQSSCLHLAECVVKMQYRAKSRSVRSNVDSESMRAARAQSPELAELIVASGVRATSTCHES